VKPSARFAVVAAAIGLAGSAVPQALLDARGAVPSATFLSKGWDDATRRRYYHESQGTQFMPAAMLEALETASGAAFMAPANMRRFGFIGDESHSAQNPYGWPIGFAVDRGDGGPRMAGFTCAACHTSEIRYRGTVMRVDGGAAAIDVNGFRKGLAEAVIATGKDPARRARFERRAVELGFPSAHVAATFEKIYQTMLHGAAFPPDYVVASTPSGPGRLDALNAIGTAVFSTDLAVPKNAQKGTAPVDFPYLWDIWRFDWVQYNASVRQPMERNVGEALGVGVRTNFIDPQTGRVNPEPLRWRSTARVRSLYWMEQALTRLRPPAWPENVLGGIDRARAARGHALFVQNCGACHGIQRIAGTTPTEWHVPVIRLERIGTDPNQAVDYASNTYDGTKLGLGASVHAPEALSLVVSHVKTQAYVDAGIPKAEWPAYDGFGREGTLFPAPCGYKARPLIGVWATGPFLHNGSVPTVYDLLSERRPPRFSFGSREFDPHKLGFADVVGPRTMLFDASITGNGNAGHWFTNDRSRRGRIGRAFNEREKYDIIEYLKAATSESYPVRTVSKPGPLPCEDDKNWASRFR
jgi:hypothetical protein